MAKSKPNPPPALFTTASPRHRRVLILPRLLAEAAESQAHIDSGPDFDNAHAILKKWADMEAKGRLKKKKETSLNANFLNDIFGNALRYKTVENAVDGVHTLERELTVPNVGSADGALGFFPADLNGGGPKPAAVIELKDADTDLDTDRSDGRTAVQQLFDYLNGLPETKWGIVSNFSTIRLYHKDRGTTAYEEFSLQKLKSDPAHFRAFWCLFERDGLISVPMRGSSPRGTTLLATTIRHQRRTASEFFTFHEEIRARLIDCLHHEHSKPTNDAARTAEVILNRIIFVALCESHRSIPPMLHPCVHQIPPCFRVSNPRWKQFLDLFWALQNGDPGLCRTHGFSYSFIAFDPQVDSLQLDDAWALALAEFADIDYKNELPPDFVSAVFKTAADAFAAEFSLRTNT